MKILGIILIAAFIFFILGCADMENDTKKSEIENTQENQAAEETEKKIEESKEESAPEKLAQDTKKPEPAKPVKKPDKMVGDKEVGVLETNFGTIVIRFYPDLAPKTVARIKELIKQGFYDGLTFHRIVPDFCIQGGDPTGTGRGGTGQNLPAEFTQTPFEDGSVGMARAQDPNSGDCQFFITLSRNDSVANLDNKYTLFGKVIEGLDIAHKIEKVECDSQKPKKQVSITRFHLNERP